MLSTGPRTEEGKKRSSRNALRHGFFCGEAYREGPEEAVEYRQLMEDTLEWAMPRSVVEQALAEALALCTWKLRLATAGEGDLSPGPGEARRAVYTVDVRERYEKRIGRLVGMMVRLEKEVCAMKKDDEVWKEANAAAGRCGAVCRNEANAGEKRTGEAAPAQGEATKGAGGAPVPPRGEEMCRNEAKVGSAGGAGAIARGEGRAGGTAVPPPVAANGAVCWNEAILDDGIWGDWSKGSRVGVEEALIRATSGGLPWEKKKKRK